MMNFCTLFDSYYLDKGILLYRSMERVTEDFTLYIFCFDEKSKQVLESIELKHAVLLRDTDLETPELLRTKESRTKAEYCWTCTPLTIEYVLDNFDVDSCTYIDSDLYFYQDPIILFEELKAEEHIIIAPHRLEDTPKGKRTASRYGTYCVQFNYFDQSQEAREALSWWKESCLEWCYCKVRRGKYGDQKYLDSFPTKFSGVHILRNLGGGVAQWNLGQYDLETADGKEITLKEKKTGIKFQIVFYHFQHIRFLPDNKVNISSGTDSIVTKKAIYYPYLKETIDIREELKQYDVSFNSSVVHSGSPIHAFYQKMIKNRRTKRVSDIVDLSCLK